MACEGIGASALHVVLDEGLLLGGQDLPDLRLLRLGAGAGLHQRFELLFGRFIEGGAVAPSFGAVVEALGLLGAVDPAVEGLTGPGTLIGARRVGGAAAASGLIAWAPAVAQLTQLFAVLGVPRGHRVAVLAEHDLDHGALPLVEAEFLGDALAFEAADALDELAHRDGAVVGARFRSAGHRAPCEGISSAGDVVVGDGGAAEEVGVGRGLVLRGGGARERGQQGDGCDIA